MKLKGFEHVRGAGWCKVEYSSVPQGVQEYLSASTKKELQGTLLSNLAE